MEAKCRPYGTKVLNLFFSKKNANQPLLQGVIKLLCAECPLRVECLMINRSNQFIRNSGVYGGLSPLDQQLARQHNITCLCPINVAKCKVHREVPEVTLLKADKWLSQLELN